MALASQNHNVEQVTIKLEPLDCHYDSSMLEQESDNFKNTYDTRYDGANSSLITVVENVVVKVEPMSYESDNDTALDLSKSQVINESSTSKDLAAKIKTEHKDSDSEDDIILSNLISIKNEDKKTGKKGIKRKKEDNYVSSKRTKKGRKPNPTVKKTFKGKSKKPAEDLYPDAVLEDIEIVTITEKERQMERKELWEKRKHMQFTCELCTVGYVVEEAFLMHMKIHTPESGAYECDLCHARLKRDDILYKHKLRHFRRYRCKVCTVLFRDKDSAACHVNRVHARRAFLCPVCQKGFKRPQYLKKHVEQMHTKETRYECPICTHVVYEKSRYRSHLRSHSEEVKKQTIKPSVICDVCSRIFKNKENLKRHLLTHEDITSTCKICFYTCKNNDVLKVHYRRQHTEVGRRMADEVDRQCSFCLRIFTTPALMRHHKRRMHTERSKKFQCDYCKRFYFSKGEVRAHIAWSHMRAASTAHACYCGRVFRTPSRLRDHELRYHMGVPLPRDHECPLCGKCFAEKQVLKRHMKSHTGETYPCKECGLTFKTQSYVDVHYKLKHLNMTRQQIKAQRQPKLVNIITKDEKYITRIKPEANPNFFNNSYYESDNISVETESDARCSVEVKVEQDDITSVNSEYSAHYVDTEYRADAEVKLEENYESVLSVPLFQTFADVQTD